MNQFEFKTQLDRKKELQHLLYRRGYLITTRHDLKIEEYPFYGNWSMLQITDEYCLLCHIDQHLYIKERNGIKALIIGHAYNPFSGLSDENEILDNLLKAYDEGASTFFGVINELTGIHLVCLFAMEEVIFVQDCTGMRTCFYGKCSDNVYITSHCQLIRDIDSPRDNAFVKKLINTRSYLRYGSMYLPGDLTVLEDFSRLGPNMFLKCVNHIFSIERFYPIVNHPSTSLEDRECIEQIAHVIKKSVHITTKKWKRPAISLSGGMDSRMTFAASTDFSDCFKYYSYFCKPSELLDADAAHELCEKLNIPHNIYRISENNDDFQDYEIYKEIILHGTAYMHFPKEHEIRKFITFSKLNDFDVELRSYASEIGRSHWSKRYGMELPEQLSAKHFNIFQTRYLFSPCVMKKGEKAYKDYMKRSLLIFPFFNYELADFFYWEYRFGSNGSIATEMMEIFNFDATIPMNNRKLMDMFLWFPHDDRRNDLVHKAVVEKNDLRFSELKKTVHDSYFDKRRVILERMYFKYRDLFD